MLIRNKTKEEIQSDVAMVKKDITMGVLRDELYWALWKKNYPKYLSKTKKLEKQRNLFEKQWILILRICENKIGNFNQPAWIKTTAANTIIEFWDYKEYLHLHKKFEQWKIKDLKFLIQHDNWNYELNIPDADRTYMLQYLIEGTPPIEFDCQSFIHKSKGVKMRWHWENFSIITNKWIMEKKQPNKLDPWDCVCMFKRFSNNDSTYNWVQHFAYYIWNGLFISKFWTEGALSISNLQEMHNFYWTKEFVSMRPNPNHEDSKIHNTNS